jgi:7-carboxy-7-deazaguanine synthase (Cx14CxxC type)
MSYAVKEIFYTLQGEGANTGRAAVFCRFSGCNLWSGREEDRSSAVCRFCDTDFRGVDGTQGGKFETAEELAAVIARTWPSSPAGEKSGTPLVVCTGGEPMLQLDDGLVQALHAAGFRVAIETNGTLPVLPSLDWVCVSPKAGAPLVQRSGDELKLVYPQASLSPTELEGLAFSHFYLQPMDGPNLAVNTRLTVGYCLQHPKWRLSLQTHKLLGLP